jgi:hypothetical protein
MIELPSPITFDLPVPWISKSFTLHNFGPINFLVGPNGSGKSRFADVLKLNLPQARLLGTDRLRGMEKNAGMGFLGENFAAGYQKNWFPQLRNAGSSLGFGIDTLILLEERMELRIRVEATLSHLFDRKITLEWDSGNLIPRAILRSAGPSYRLDTDECHGIKELLILLTHLYHDSYKYLIVDEPELNLHPQYQAFFLQEARKVAGNPEQGNGKKVLFFVTHSPFILDFRSVDDLRSVISFDLLHGNPRRIEVADNRSESELAKLVPRLNVHHKQLFFSDNPIFVEGILDSRMIHGIQEARGVSTAASGSCIIDAGGCEEVNHYLKLCDALGQEGVFPLRFGWSFYRRLTRVHF